MGNTLADGAARDAVRIDHITINRSGVGDGRPDSRPFVAGRALKPPMMGTWNDA
jgi:hypothetical protein